MTVPGGKGMFIQGLCFLSPQETQDALRQGALLIDLRSDELFGMKAFGGSEGLHLPHPTLADHAADLPRDRLLILADSAGVYTKAAAAALKGLGFEQIACLNGGMLAWDQEGFPVTTDPGALLHGGCACVMRPRQDREVLQVPASSASEALRELRRAGLVTERKEGRWVFVSVAPDIEASPMLKGILADALLVPEARQDLVRAGAVKAMAIAVICARVHGETLANLESAHA